MSMNKKVYGEINFGGLANSLKADSQSSRVFNNSKNFSRLYHPISDSVTFVFKRERPTHSQFSSKRRHLRNFLDSV